LTNASSSNLPTYHWPEGSSIHKRCACKQKASDYPCGQVLQLYEIFEKSQYPMNSALQGTRDSTLKTFWGKGKNHFCIYFWKKYQRKPFCTYFWKKSNKKFCTYFYFEVCTYSSDLL